MKNKKVMFFDDEREADDGWIVTLNAGWCFDQGCHVMGFDTKAEATEAVTDAEVCKCKECKGE